MKLTLPAFLSRQVDGLPITKPGRRPADNFLLIRIIAALMVIYGHAKHIAPAVEHEDIFLRLGLGIYSGDIAVNCFFFLSGLMVSGSWCRHPRFFEFYKARFLRLLPAYFVHLLLIAFLFGPLLSSFPIKQYFASGTPNEYVLKNMHLTTDMAWKLPGVFETNPKTTTINGSQWTLPAEFIAYILLGILGAIGLFKLHRLALIPIGAICLIGFFAPSQLPFHPDWFRLLGYFSLGIVTFLYSDQIKISWTGFIVAAIGLYVFRGSGVYPYIFALCLAYFILWFGYGLPPFSSILEKLGDPSYGIYLYGWFAQQLVVLYFPGAGLKTHVISASLIAILIGYTSWHSLEKWVLRWK